MALLLCTGRDGIERTFDYGFEKDQFEETWHFRVQTVPPQPNAEAFDLSVTALDDATLRQIMLAHHNNPVYAAMGIPDALIPVVAAVLGKKVVSSPTTADDAGVYRTESATKVWDRLRDKGHARYDSDTDVYEYTGNEIDTLVLSGGGFRATFHHLGVLLYLAATGRLDSIKSLIGVSGGGVIAAHIVARWNECGSVNDFVAVAGKLVRFARENPRDRALIAWLWSRLWPVNWFGPAQNRTSHLRRQFARLFARETIAAISERAKKRLALVATDARRLQHIIFTPDHIFRVRLGDEQPSNEVEGRGMLVHDAVTASACFPPVFGRILMDHEAIGCTAEEWQESIDVNDGGVLDNLGVFALRALGLDWRGRVLISNAERGQTHLPGNSPLADFSAQGLGHSLRAKEAFPGIQDAEILTTEFRNRTYNRLGLDFRTKTMLAKYRTDFDAPTWQELNALMIHGAALCAEQLTPHDTLTKEGVRSLVKAVLVASGFDADNELAEPTEEDLRRCDRRPIGRLLRHLFAFAALIVATFILASTLLVHGRTLYRWAFVPPTWVEVSQNDSLPWVPQSTSINVLNVARDYRQKNKSRSPERAFYAYRWIGEKVQLPHSFELAPDSKASFRFALSEGTEGTQGDAHPLYVEAAHVNDRSQIVLIVFPLDEQAERTLRTKGLPSIIVVTP
jgi:predicted acylesterase/phospholipase RssA